MLDGTSRIAIVWWSQRDSFPPFCTPSTTPVLPMTCRDLARRSTKKYHVVRELRFRIPFLKISRASLSAPFHLDVSRLVAILVGG